MDYYIAVPLKMYGKFVQTKFKKIHPSTEIGQKITNGGLLLLALMYTCIHICIIVEPQLFGRNQPIYSLE